ncbi:MAG: hypothetical protein QNJ13_03015 [Paracoccaceae bacterium]|nr:hypothetical protein [Paracoccaceae bacterium]
MPLDQKFPLTFPNEVAAEVCREYDRAHTILEYGSGGSTIYAAGVRGLRLISVESDRDWAKSIGQDVEAMAPLGARVDIHYADVGPTREWGYPRHRKYLHAWRYLQYARSVWRRPDFVHPDLVLIDGRFRVSCFLTVLTKIKRPTRVLWDDYTDRPHYHWIERLAKPTAFYGRMAVFDLRPGRIPLPVMPIAFRQSFTSG